MNIIRKLEKYFFPDTPRSATWPEWKKIRAEQKNKHPLAYWLFNKLPSLLWAYNQRYIQDTIWSFKYRFLKKHQYHIIRTELKPEYHELDTMMLYGMMSIIVRFVERQHPFCGMVWDKWVAAAKADATTRKVLKKYNIAEKWEYQLMPDTQIDAYLTCDKIYKWWRDTYPNRVELDFDYPDGFDPLMFFGGGAEHDESMKADRYYPVYLEWKRHNEATALQEQNWIQEEQDMLLEVVRIRKHLWT